MGWAGCKAVLYIGRCGKGQFSLPPATCSVALPFVDFAVSKVSSQVWPKTSQGGGDEQRESFQHCQPKSLFTFSVELQKSKRNGQPRQSGSTERGHLPIVDLAYAVLGASPAHLCKSARSHYKTQWDLNLLSLVLLNLIAMGEDAISQLHLD